MNHIVFQRNRTDILVPAVNSSIPEIVFPMSVFFTAFSTQTFLLYLRTFVVAEKFVKCLQEGRLGAYIIDGTNPKLFRFVIGYQKETVCGALVDQ